MHPLLGRYLDLNTTVDAIDRIDRGESLSDDEKALATVLRRAPDQKTAVLDARGKKHPSDPVQQALVYLAANAAVEQLREDPATVSAVARADLALRSNGASDVQVAAFLATVVVEEAFGYDEDPDAFDLPLVIETLERVPSLVALDADKVEQLREKLGAASPERTRARAQHAFDVLLEVAWSDGPEPINLEHVSEAAAVFDDDQDREQLAPVIRFLGAEGIIGPLRLGKLLDALEDL